MQDDPALRSLVQLAASARAIRWSTQGAPGEASQATVTLAEISIAQTGSILGKRRVRRARRFGDCSLSYCLRDGNPAGPGSRDRHEPSLQQQAFGRNSFACVISGSSRTADIEKILVQGAHGPRRLVVILQS